MVLLKALNAVVLLRGAAAARVAVDSESLDTEDAAYDGALSGPGSAVPRLGPELRLAAETYKAARELRETTKLCLSGAYWADSEFKSLAANPWAACGAGYDLSHARGGWRYSAESPTPCAKANRSDAAVFQTPAGLEEWPVEMRVLGKMAKGGDFFRTPDGFLLVKKVNKGEMNVLRKIGAEGRFAEFHGDCDTLSRSLMLPTPLTFYHDSAPFVVMMNETQVIEKALGSGWSLTSGLDLKPLPNIPRDLVDYLQALRPEWKGAAAPQHWRGWAAVREMIRRDLALLDAYTVIDHSIFVHVATRDPGASGRKGPVPGLGPENGCVTAPDGEAVICFKLIDYLVIKSGLRKIESALKGGKFDDYMGKFQVMMDCLGDLSAKGCEAYQDFAHLMDADDSDGTAFVRSSLFAENYECTLEVPEEDFDGERVNFVIDDEEEEDDEEEAAPSASSRLVLSPLRVPGTTYRGRGFSSQVAHYVQRSMEPGKFVSDVASSLGDAGAQCEGGIKDFSTAGLKAEGSNIMSTEDSLWVAREQTGKMAWYVRAARESGCDLKLRFFRCRPEGGAKQVSTTYSSTYGHMELMQVLTK